MIIFCSIYRVNMFWFNIQLALFSFLFLWKTLVLGTQIRCPQSWYSDPKSALYQPLIWFAFKRGNCMLARDQYGFLAAFQTFLQYD